MSSRVPWGEGGQRTRLGGARGVWEPVPGGPDPGAKLGSSRRCCHLVATSGSSRRRAGSPGVGSSLAGAGGGCGTPAPAPPRPSPAWAAAPCLHPQMWLPPPRTPPSPASASVIGTRALLCCPGSMPGCPGVGRPGAPDEPHPHPGALHGSHRDGGGQALPAPAFHRHLLRTYCAPRPCGPALAGLPSQRGPARGAEGGGGAEATLEAPQVRREGVREGDGQKQSSGAARDTETLPLCGGDEGPRPDGRQGLRES